MPSNAAWAGATLYYLYRDVLSAPVSLLVGSVLPNEAAQRFLAALRWPFWTFATLALWTASLVQTGILVEEFATDRIGTALNSRLASKSHPTTANSSSLIDSLLLAESPSSPMAYSETLSALLDEPLALPVRSDPDAEPFSSEDMREWNEASEVLRGEMERGMQETAARWVEVIEWVPSTLRSRSSPGGDESEADPASLSQTRNRFGRSDYLNAVLAELEAVNSREPTRQIYSTHEPTSEEWDRVEQAERNAEKKRACEREARFEAWLDAVMTGASPFKSPSNGDEAAAAAAAAAAKRSDDDLEAERRRRAMLDVPLAGPGQPGLTWRDQLREQWALMFDTAQGGVLGNVERELEKAFEALGGGEAAAAREEGVGVGVEEWLPGPVQIMAAHHLRAQVASAQARIDSTLGSRFPPDDPEWERATLPPLLDTVANEHLSLEQLAIRVDRRARQWADRLLDFVSRKPGARSPSAPIARLSIRERTQLLRDSPFPAFMRAVDATFKAPRDPAHFRIGISSHDLANAIFAIRTDGTAAMAPRPARSRGQKEGGVSAVQREIWRRAASDEELEVVRRQVASEAAGATEQAGSARVLLSRDEL